MYRNQRSFFRDQMSMIKVICLAGFLYVLVDYLEESKQDSKDSNTQEDSEIIEQYKQAKIKLRISFNFLEFVLKGNGQGN